MHPSYLLSTKPSELPTVAMPNLRILSTGALTLAFPLARARAVLERVPELRAAGQDVDIRGTGL